MHRSFALTSNLSPSPIKYSNPPAPNSPPLFPIKQTTEAALQFDEAMLWRVAEHRRHRLTWLRHILLSWHILEEQRRMQMCEERVEGVIDGGVWRIA